jgi:effector-binding domain-containing protein
MGFTLAEIKLIISQCKNETEIKDFIRSKLEEIDGTINRLISKKNRLRHFLSLMTVEKPPQIQIKETTLPRILIAGIIIHGKYEEISQGFLKLMKHLGGSVRGKPLCLHFEIEYKDADASFMPCFEIKRAVAIPGIECFTIKSCKIISMVHKGPYTTLGEAYFRLFSYMQDKKYTVKLPIIEKYLKGPGLVFKGKPQHYLTEISIPI